MTAGAAANGARFWFEAHTPRWMTQRLMKAASARLLTIGILAAGLQL